MTRSTISSALVAVLGAAALPAQQTVRETCRAASPTHTSTALLDRAADAMGLRALGGKVLHYEMGTANAAAEQSDRWYPPYIMAVRLVDAWADPATGVLRTTPVKYVWPGSGNTAGVSTLSSATATYQTRDTLVRAANTVDRAGRAQNPWLAVTEWRGDTSVRYRNDCLYRDRWRAVLERPTLVGRERLYVDPSTGYPVKLEWDEPHYLWGQIHVEHVYASWISPRGGTASYPGMVSRVENGETIGSYTTSGVSIALVPKDSAPALAMPANAPDMRHPLAATYGGRSPEPDTVRVGTHSFLLVNPSYTEAVTLERDTVFLLDATIGEARARQDSAWIAKLFPGRHPVAVVVTDLAWPHVAGVRYWVARGATIVSHPGSKGFLEKVTAQRWTLDPDALERNRSARTVALRFRPVNDSLSLGGGAIRLYPIDGPGSEGALMAYLPNDRFLWAGDYVQTTKRPSQYAIEVEAAARRVGIAPERLAAMHIPLSTWSELVTTLGTRTSTTR
jgi:hypothetical protein